LLKHIRCDDDDNDTDDDDDDDNNNNNNNNNNNLKTLFHNSAGKLFSKLWSTAPSTLAGLKTSNMDKVIAGTNII
jgi:hypothetical protein